MPEPVPGNSPQGPHHGLAAHEVVLLLGPIPGRGSDDDEARRRLDRYGPNVLPEAQSTGPLVRFALQFNHPLIYVLLASVGVTVALGDYAGGSRHLRRGADQRRHRIHPRVQGASHAGCTAGTGAHGRQGPTPEAGSCTSPPSRSCRGDIVVVEAGDKVPPTCGWWRRGNCRSAVPHSPASRLPWTRTSSCCRLDTVAGRGTWPTRRPWSRGPRGGGRVSTGSDTELGHIHRLVSSADPVATPLTGDAHSVAWSSPWPSSRSPPSSSGSGSSGVAVGRHVHRRRRARGRGDPGGPARRGHGHPRDRGRSDGTAGHDRATTAGGRDPREHHRLLGQDRHTHRESDDRAALGRRGARTPSLGPGTRPRASPGGRTGRVDGVAALVPGRRRACNDSVGSRTGPGHRRRSDQSHAPRRPGRAASTTGTWPPPSLGLLHPVRLATSVHGHGPSPRRRRYGRDLGQGRGGAGPRALYHGELGDEVRYLRSMWSHHALPTGSPGRPPGARLRHGRGAHTLRRGPSGTRVTGVHGVPGHARPTAAAAAAAVRSCQSAGIDVKMITGDHPPPRLPSGSGWACSATYDGRRRRHGGGIGVLPPEGLRDSVQRPRSFRPGLARTEVGIVEALQRPGHFVAMTGDGVNDAPRSSRPTSASPWAARHGGGQRGGGHDPRRRQLRHHRGAVKEGGASSTTSPSSSPGRFPPTWPRDCHPGRHLLGLTLPAPAGPDPLDQHDDRRLARTHARLRAEGGRHHVASAT